MANLNPPPQAYTRETLTQAFEWLHQQPPQVRETAGSMDAMVAMYLQAKRRGVLSNGTDLASAQNFKKDLKHLAEDLKKFEGPTAAQMQAAQAPIQQNAYPNGHTVMPNFMPQQPTPVPAPMPAPMPSAAPTIMYDSRTMDTIQTVREAFNLGSDAEALRLLVSAGFEHIRQILPKT